MPEPRLPKKAQRGRRLVRGRPKRVLPGGWLSAEQIAPIVGYSSRWVRRHLGHLAKRLNGRDYRWRETDVQAWIESQEPAPVLVGEPSAIAPIAVLRSSRSVP